MHIIHSQLFTRLPFGWAQLLSTMFFFMWCSTGWYSLVRSYLYTGCFTYHVTMGISKTARKTRSVKSVVLNGNPGYSREPQTMLWKAQCLALWPYMYTKFIFYSIMYTIFLTFNLYRFGIENIFLPAAQYFSLFLLTEKQLNFYG